TSVALTLISSLHFRRPVPWPSPSSVRSRLPHRLLPSPESPASLSPPSAARPRPRRGISSRQSRMGESAVTRRSSDMNKRKRGQKSGGKVDKRKRALPSPGKKIDKRMKQLFRKRARQYNSDDEDDGKAKDVPIKPKDKYKEKLYKNDDDDIGTLDQNELSDEEDTDMQPGITKFTEGCRAFRVAFVQTMKKHIDDDLGPILSAHKKLVIEKLAEEDDEKKAKSDSKKEKQMVAEKGHVKPANYLDSHEKFLIGVATKGVVKLFNAVNKAQTAQKGLNPSRTKDAKVLKQRRKQVFLKELSKSSGQSTEGANKALTSNGKDESEQPSWGPLRDTYMLTNPKLKDWDKMQDTTAADDIGMMSEDSYSSDDE
ncbi:hypothetical protein V2J09_002673, partial [Rumex salicifolius]